MDNEAPLFAPLKFIHVVDILETFSGYVFLRMKKLSFPNKTDDEIKKLTCKNIFSKFLLKYLKFCFNSFANCWSKYS